MGTMTNPTYVDYQTVEKLIDINSLRNTPTDTVITTNGTLNLSIDSSYLHTLHGNTTGFTVILPNATTIKPGWKYEFQNESSQIITVKDYVGTVLLYLPAASIGFATLQHDGSPQGQWSAWSIFVSTAAGIINYYITSDTPFVTSSLTDVIITGFSVTPQAGTYAIWYNSDATATQNNAIVTHTIYRGGASITSSLRRTQTVSSNFIFQQTTQTIAQFDGIQTCDVRVKITNGVLTINGRSLTLIRLGI